MQEKTKVALVNSPFLKGVFHHPLLIPLGLAYLAAVLEKDGQEVKIIDCPACKMDHEDLKKELASFNPTLIGITSTTPTTPSALQSARAAKEACPDAKVILGGPHATFMDREILSEEEAVDIVVRGEGEQTLLELAQKGSDPKALQDISGLTFKKNEEIIQTPDRSFIEDLDGMPRPEYKFFPLEKYRMYGKMFLPIITSRGCPYQCSFCVTSQIFGKKFRARSPTNIVDELEWLRDTHGADGISFYDDAFTLDRKRLTAICDEIIDRKIGLPWGCQTRVDHVTQEVLALMKKANCNEVSFGVESGCQRILDAVGKKTSVEQNENAIKWAKDEGLFVAVSAIIAYPGETKETVNQTIDLLRRMEPDDAYLCIATPYPGTKLRSIVESSGWKISNDWSLYDTMNPVVENPNLPAEELSKIRKDFYNSFYSPRYAFRQFVKGSIKGNFYSQMMTRLAVNHLIWRVKSVF
jgi:anaerobic magnesium-protoporphyrin IX monomethyl ester cyclase